METALGLWKCCHCWWWPTSDWFFDQAEAHSAALMSGCQGQVPAWVHSVTQNQNLGLRTDRETEEKGDEDISKMYIVLRSINL